MLWTDGKKIDAAFGRLRERRIAVGDTSAAESPEAEAKRIEQELATASASGDISTILRIIATTSSLTPTDYIKKTCGSLLFLYYTYMEKLKQRPVDMNDMIDGLSYLDARGYIMKRTTEQK